MKYMIFAVLAASASVATAQQATPATDMMQAMPAPAATTAPVMAPVQRALPVNTVIQVSSSSEISSKKIDVGDRFTFNVVADVVENQVVVIPRGAEVIGEVTFKTGRAIGGKSGKFEITFRTITLNGQSYPLTGVHRQEGRGNTVAAVFASIWVTGRSAVMQPGQVTTAQTAAPINY